MAGIKLMVFRNEQTNTEAPKTGAGSTLESGEAVAPKQTTQASSSSPLTGAGSTLPATSIAPLAPLAFDEDARETDEETNPCNRFEGKVIEITSFDGELPALLQKKKAKLPHWDEKGSYTDPTGGSTSPVIVPVRKGTKLKATIKIRVDKAEGIAGTGKIRGVLTDRTKIILEGEFPVKVGTHETTVELSATETTLARHRGNIMWEVDVQGCGKHSIGASLLEVYRIIEDSKHDFLSDGRPVEALRFIYDNMNVSGINVSTVGTSDIATTAKITSYLHTSHSLVYDTVQGASYYLDIKNNTDAHFKLYSYIDKSGGAIVNCYDQASSVNVFCGILGASGEKVFVMPFGYITETTLVGGVSSNNPFYTATSSSPVVDRLSPQRTPFGNHQFYIDKSSMIFDACAGPHLGTENYLQYMNNSVDVTVKETHPPQNNPSGIVPWAIIPNIFKISKII